MNKLNMLLVGLAVSALTLIGCQPVNAAPLDIKLGYMDNNLINKEGVQLAVGTEVNNVRLGVSTLTSDKRLETYGVYAGIPINVQGTRFTVTPNISVDRYHKIGEVVGGIGANLEFALTPTLRIEGGGSVNRSFDSGDYSDTVYNLGLVKRF